MNRKCFKNPAVSKVALLLDYRIASMNSSLSKKVAFFCFLPPFNQIFYFFYFMILTCNWNNFLDGFLSKAEPISNDCHRTRRVRIFFYSKSCRQRVEQLRYIFFFNLKIHGRDQQNRAGKNRIIWARRSESIFVAGKRRAHWKGAKIQWRLLRQADCSGASAEERFWIKSRAVSGSASFQVHIWKAVML